MPAAAAAATTAITGLSLSAAVAAGGATLVAWASPLALTDDVPPPEDHLLLSVINDELTAARAAGNLQVRTFDGWTGCGERLIGPLITAGNCMDRAGLTNGLVAFADPTLPCRGGDIVCARVASSAIVRSGSPFGGAACTVKFLERLANDWWLRDADDNLVRLHSGVTLLGRVVLTLSTGTDTATSRWAARQAQVLDGRSADVAVPDDVRAELTNRAEVDRTPYPWRVLVGRHFWRTLELGSVETKLLREDIA